MSQAIHVLGFSGSLRQGSYNTHLLHIAQGLLPDGMELELFHLAPLPMYNADLDTATPPDSVSVWREKVQQADALLIACPEYNYSVTGALKNAFDWASRLPKGSPEGRLPAIYGKVYALMGVGGRFGTVRAQMHFRQIAASMDMKGVGKPEIYISNIPKRVFDEDTKLTDETALKLMGELLNNLNRLAHLHQETSA